MSQSEQAYMCVCVCVHVGAGTHAEVWRQPWVLDLTFTLSWSRVAVIHCCVCPSGWFMSFCRFSYPFLPFCFRNSCTIDMLYHTCLYVCCGPRILVLVQQILLSHLPSLTFCLESLCLDMLEDDPADVCRPHNSVPELLPTKLCLRTLGTPKHDCSFQMLDSFKWHRKKSFRKLKSAMENEAIFLLLWVLEPWEEIAFYQSRLWFLRGSFQCQTHSLIANNFQGCNCSQTRKA